MDIKQIKYIVTLSETCSMTRAAEQLHISQPALSQTCHAVENELGMTLFNRTGRNLSITPDGAYFCEEGKKLLAHYKTFKRHMRERADQRFKTMTFYTDVVDNSDETMFIYQKLNPETNFLRFYGSTDDTVPMLEQDTIDFSLTLRSLAIPGFTTIRLIEEDVVVLVRSDSRLAEKKDLWIKDLTGETLVIYQNSGSLRQLFDDFIADGDASLKRVMDAYDPILQIQKNGGFIFMPESTYNAEKKGGRLGNCIGVHVNDSFCKRRVFLTYRTNLEQNPVFARYFDFLKEYHRISIEEHCLPDLQYFSSRLPISHSVKW